MEGNANKVLRPSHSFSHNNCSGPPIGGSGLPATCLAELKLLDTSAYERTLRKYSKVPGIQFSYKKVENTGGDLKRAGEASIHLKSY